MTDKEKAKRFDEAIKNLKGMIPSWELLSYNGKTFLQDLFYILPELKESEDERIRKDIVFYIAANHKDDVEKAHWLYWLEKQGEPVKINPTEFDSRLQALIGKFDSLPKEELIGSLSFWMNVVQNDGTYKSDENQGEQKETLCDKCKKAQPSHFCQDITELGRCAVEHEQKPADKVEPKFHEGDWVVIDGEALHIIEVTEDGYLTDEGGHIPFRCNKEAHIWSIADAKDGEVLFIGIDGSTCIFKRLEGNLLYSYIISDGKLLVEDSHYYYETSDNVYPATKEQRDLLFQKMKEAGYVWDAEKKELKKIKKAPQKFMVGDTIRYNGTEYKITEITPNGYKVYALTYDEDAASLISFSAPAILVEQKPAWSEANLPEFESYLCLMFQKFRTKGMCTNGEIIDYVKEHSQKLRDILVKPVGFNIGDEITVNGQVCRVVAVNNLAWSEEDENKLKSIEYHLDCDNAPSELYYWLEDRLKSLRPQNMWKPSDEQMIALRQVISGCSYDIEPLAEIEEHLKKLREA